MTAVKNPSSWIAQSGTGYVLTVGLQDFQDNLGNLIIDNSLNNIATTPDQVIPKYPSQWTGSGV